MSVAARKEELRRRIIRGRAAEPDKEAKSRAILERVFRLPPFRQARTVLFYVDAGSEVRTRAFIPRAMALGKRVAVPYCARDEQGQDALRLFLLQDLQELEPGAFGILEPKPELRGYPERALAAQEVDMVLVPGVVFDRRGGRIGHGWGYYDRLLRSVRPDCWLVGLAYECQVVEEVPMEPRDVFVDLVVTERAVYVGRGRPSGTRGAGWVL
ncbi:MAG: 5-formyltetrahydrofolate cyclo-ligase [Armatimonadota bacterium]|nr:5-formyltetrahydrofolate cyclo-ligase [Armatimonadota bacterium]MDR7444448.1 5-formyltetrahydrofolate cyclo-ligase [Armatimonadota bacterium]MDR7570150.1 5-formyltetrahydrofolate cyclo-ligase [Armatimonadota bacterium]MDR7615247.1 5-formyltetrahydrofolate cyclo-ligase [Armatimonadota bacterium]